MQTIVVWSVLQIDVDGMTAAWSLLYCWKLKGALLMKLANERRRYLPSEDDRGNLALQVCFVDVYSQAF